LKRASTVVGFIFFIFDLEYLIRVQNSELLHAKMNPTSSLFGSRFAFTQTSIFSAKPCSKNAEETSIVLGLRLMSKEVQHPTIQTKEEQHFFHQINVSQPIGRHDSMQNGIRTSRRWDSFSNISRVKLKNLKPIVIDVLFKTYPMAPLSCRSNLAGRYL
jgi:hypothetical protein